MLAKSVHRFDRFVSFRRGFCLMLLHSCFRRQVWAVHSMVYDCVLAACTFSRDQPYEQHRCHLRYVFLSWHEPHWEVCLRIRPTDRVKHQKILSCNWYNLPRGRCHGNFLHHTLHQVHFSEHFCLDLGRLRLKRPLRHLFLLACRVACMAAVNRRQIRGNQSTQVYSQSQWSSELRAGRPQG